VLQKCYRSTIKVLQKFQRSFLPLAPMVTATGIEAGVRGVGVPATVTETLPFAALESMMRGTLGEVPA
jgi:hypothetical protein